MGGKVRPIARQIGSMLGLGTVRLDERLAQGSGELCGEAMGIHQEHFSPWPQRGARGSCCEAVNEITSWTRGGL